MSRAKNHQRPDPTTKDLVDYLSELPRQLGVWRAGQHGLYHLLLTSSLERAADLAHAQHNLDIGDAADAWRHTTSTLIEWHSQWAQRDRTGEPLRQDIDAAIRRAREWRALDVILLGLRNGDMHIVETSGWDIRIGNSHEHAIEVLDIILQQVSIPADSVLAVVSLDPVHAWFADHAGRPDATYNLPKWARAVMYRWALAELVNRDLTMPEDTNLGDLSLADARKCYAFLIAGTELATLCTTILGSKETAVWYSESRRLRESLMEYVSQESAEAFIRLCTFSPGRNPASAPLIADGSLFAIPAALISPVGFERTLLRAASADPARGGRLGNALGRRATRWADRLRAIPGALVAERVPVQNSSGQKIGDLDVAAFDPGRNLVLVVETKWPVDAHTLRETIKIDDAIEDGRQQVSRIRTAIADGATVRWPTGWNIKPDTVFRWWVGTAQQLATRPGHNSGDIRTTSLRLLEHVLPAFSLADLQERLEHFPLPRPGSEYELIDQTVRAGRYRFTFPALRIFGDPPMPPEDRRTNRGWT
jgi:hypothetical protein